MNIFKLIKKSYTGKTFWVELEEKYTYPNEKDFIYPNALITCAAIEKFGVQSKQIITFISREKPITFLLNNKEKYQANLLLGCGRYHSGYYIFCSKIDS